MHEIYAAKSLTCWRLRSEKFFHTSNFNWSKNFIVDGVSLDCQNQARFSARTAVNEYKNYCHYYLMCNSESEMGKSETEIPSSLTLWKAASRNWILLNIQKGFSWNLIFPFLHARPFPASFIFTGSIFQIFDNMSSFCDRKVIRGEKNVNLTKTPFSVQLFPF